MDEVEEDTNYNVAPSRVRELKQAVFVCISLDIRRTLTGA